MDWSPPGSSVHGILQARILEWVAISFSRRSSRPRDQTSISCIGRQILYHWATWEALKLTICTSFQDPTLGELRYWYWLALGQCSDKPHCWNVSYWIAQAATTCLMLDLFGTVFLPSFTLPAFKVRLHHCPSLLGFNEWPTAFDSLNPECHFLPITFFA